MYAPDINELLGVPGGAHQSESAPSVLVPADGAGNIQASLGGAYDGADRFDRALAMWSPALMSADNEIIPDKGTVDARVRDVVRNDAYVASGCNLHKDNIVGSTFLLNAKPATKVLWGKDDETWEVEFQEEVETKFTLWAESPDNWVDAARQNTFSELVRLAVGVHVMGGEVLGSVEWIRDEPERLLKTAIQMIDIDRLSTPFTEVEGGKKASGQTIRGGVQRNRRGAPLGYHVRDAHPTDYRNFDNFTWSYVPVRKPWGRLQMIHIYEQTRPDQTRGIAEMVTALKEMRITKKFRDVVLQNAVVQSSYAATIESDLPTDAIFQILGGGNLTQENVGKAISSYMTGYLGNVAKYVGNSRSNYLGGVKVPHLPPGSKFNLTSAGSGGPLGTDFEQSLLRYIASSLGVSYEQLSRDYPKAVGPGFLDIYKRIIADRLEAKRLKDKVRDLGGKIAVNGVYGKTGSKWSFLYAPHLMIAVTLTGQLTLLMLIERAESAGISVVSGNTDGVVFHCPRGMEDLLFEITAEWEKDTGFTLEFARYRSIYNASVNTYVAVKEDGTVKRKGTVSNPWGEGDKRAQLMKNPSATICSDAAVVFITEGVPVEQTIRASRDIRAFVTVVNVTGGGTWCDQYLGKVVRYMWSNIGHPILYKEPHPSTGNFKKVSKSDGCRPLMELPDDFPSDIDYDRYIAEAKQILVDIGATDAPPPPIKAVALHPRDAALAWALAA